MKIRLIVFFAVAITAFPNPLSSGGSETIEKVVKIINESYLWPEHLNGIQTDKLPADTEKALDEIFKRLDRWSKYKKLPPPAFTAAASCAETAAAFAETRFMEARVKKIAATKKEVVIGYVKIKEVPNCAAYNFKMIIAEFLKAGAEEGIIDLRGCVGGFVHETAKIATLFLPKNTAIAIESGRVSSQRFLLNRLESENNHPIQMPLVVIVNKETASACEILALALRQKPKTILAGTTTFGKNTFQSLISVDNYVLKITAGTVYGPNGEDFKNGVEPDITVLPKKNKDSQLEAAYEIIKSRH